MFLLSGNPFECDEEVSSLQPMIPPKRFDIFPLDGGCSEGIDALKGPLFPIGIKHLIYMNFFCYGSSFL